MADVIILNQTNFSKATYDNGMLIIEKRTGGYIQHRNVPQSVFLGFESTGNQDSYYKDKIETIYPTY